MSKERRVLIRTEYPMSLCFFFCFFYYQESQSQSRSVICKVFNLFFPLFRLHCVKFRAVFRFISARLLTWTSVLDKGVLRPGRLVCCWRRAKQRPGLCVLASLRPCHGEAYFPPTAKCPLKCESGKLGLMCCLEIKVVAMKAWAFTRFCALWEFCRLSAKVLSQQRIDLWIASL